MWAAGLLAADQTNTILNVVPPQTLVIKPGSRAEAKITFRLSPGYHTNSNTPSEEYLIPLRLTWSPGPLETVSIEYPKGQQEKYSFSTKPLSVYTGSFDITTRFQAPVSAPKGRHTLQGKLRFQACTNTVCYPPKTIPLELGVSIQ
jgi:hypothetical protein